MVTLMLPHLVKSGGMGLIPTVDMLALAHPLVITKFNTLVGASLAIALVTPLLVSTLTGFSSTVAATTSLSSLALFCCSLLGTVNSLLITRFGAGRRCEIIWVALSA